MTVRDIEVTGKRVLMRVDFNVPLDEKAGIITDDSRIRASLPTINYLIEKGARVILCSHLGRPDGKVVESLRLDVVGQRLSQLLGKPVVVTRDCIGADVERAVGKLKNGDVLLLENLRFHIEEEKNDPAFAQVLARLADVYVNDAFGTAHRAHASTVGVTKHLPAVAGFLLEKEIDTLGGIIENPARPFGLLLGGAKISDKVGMLENIIGKADYLLIGGGMAGTFLKSQAREIGQSLVEPEMLDTARGLIKKATEKRAELLLPEDVVVADEISADAKIVRTVPARNIPRGLRIADIGPETIKKFEEKLGQCKTIFWNGPMGVYEIPRFAVGTKQMAEFLASVKARTIIGGGSTAEMIYELGLAEKMTFVSTGGGASLTFLSGKTLPGVAALLKKNK